MNDEEECSYCGKMIYADTPRCPKCGNYTDGLGSRARSENSGSRIKTIYVVAGLLVVFAMLLPVIMALLEWFKLRH